MNKMNYGCEGLCATISGITSGIGLAAALRFLNYGAWYIFWDAPWNAVRRLCELSGGADRKTGGHISCDVTNQAECKAAWKRLPSRKAADWQLDILVNSAGFYR